MTPVRRGSFITSVQHAQRKLHQAGCRSRALHFQETDFSKVGYTGNSGDFLLHRHLGSVIFWHRTHFEVLKAEAHHRKKQQV